MIIYYIYRYLCHWLTSGVLPGIITTLLTVVRARGKGMGVIHIYFQSCASHWFPALAGWSRCGRRLGRGGPIETWGGIMCGACFRIRGRGCVVYTWRSLVIVACSGSIRWRLSVWGGYRPIGWWGRAHPLRPSCVGELCCLSWYAGVGSGVW